LSKFYAMSFVKQYVIVFNQFCMIQNQGFLITCCYSYVIILSLEKVDFPPSVGCCSTVALSVP